MTEINQDVLSLLRDHDKQIATLEANMKNITKDLCVQKEMLRENSDLAKEIRVEIKTMGRVLTSMMALIGLGITVATFVIKVAL